MAGLADLFKKLKIKGMPEPEDKDKKEDEDEDTAPEDKKSKGPILHPAGIKSLKDVFK